ncbi:MAG: hypothetical protein ACXWP4_01335 [Polyangiales bacterium]
MKEIDWSSMLTPEDLGYLQQKIDPSAWYPMESFERMGNAILRRLANNDVQSVRMWGRFSAEPLRNANPQLVAENDPVETLMRFRVLRSGFFDFEGLELPALTDDHAEVVVRYHMGATAEEAAAHQTLGFFEKLLELAGATGVLARFTERSWKGDARTLISIDWVSPD